LPKPSLRFHLRERTAAAHAALDEAVGAFDSLKTYRYYLYSLLAFREPTEAALAQTLLPQSLADWRLRPIAAAIRADMADLALRQPAAALPRRDLLDELRELPRLLGTLYVLEGASLGARLLLRRALALGLSSGFGARHLALQADDRLGWRRFLEILERHEPIEIDAAAEASAAAFARAHHAFARVPDGR
jgi:heme oxygenase